LLNNIIQIAGVIDLEEALMLVDHQVEYIGFPLRLKDGREDISEEDARLIISKIKPQSKPVLITYLEKSKEISEFCKYLDVDIIQLHGEIELNEIKYLKGSSPNLLVIKSLIVKENNMEELSHDINIFSQYADLFITDTYDRVTGRTGATGKAHDWEISSKIVELSPKPVILAGGLNPNNVREAILKVKPAGVDSHTGVESPDGKKSLGLVREFVTEAQKGFNNLLNY
jgi:phosphoribosylanthranilate isomerase